MALGSVFEFVADAGAAARVAHLRKPRRSGWWHATIARRGPRAVHPLFLFPTVPICEDKGAGLAAA